MSTTDDEPEINGKSDTDDGPEDAATAAASDAVEADEGGGDGDAVDAATPVDDDPEAAVGAPTLASQRAAREAARTAKQKENGLARSAKRYGPFVLVAVILAGAIAIFSGKDTDESDQEETATGSLDEDELITSGPMTPAKAELEGVEVDFGENCDTQTGRIKLPSLYAAPCVEPFEGDNGGATSQGVTEDEILIVRYESDPSIDPVGASLVRATGVDTDPEAAFQTAHDFNAIFNEVYETYGRKIRMVEYLGTGASDDAEAARNDAIKIAEMKPFAVINGPLQSVSTFSAELASRGVLCIAPCAQSLPDSVAEENAPYLWQNGATPDQSAAMAGELIGNLAPPGKAELAGDPAIQAQDRVYALVHYNTPEGTHTAVADALTQALADKGVDIDEDIEYLLEASTIQEDARTLVARLENAGATTVIFYGDPLMPASLTKEATAQDYHPEWILGPNLLADVAVFGRSFDQDQWQNGFGIGLNTLRGEDDTADAWIVYDWAYGKEAPSNAYSSIYPGIRIFFTGVHLAGPNLTPETFRDGMFRYPVSGGYPSRAQISWGSHGVWEKTPDYGGSEDAAVIWWDPDAVGTDETGADGKGLYRYANGGERYTIGNFPENAEEAGLFDDANSLTIVDQLPPEAILDYPKPDLSD